MDIGKTELNVQVVAHKMENNAVDYQGNKYYQEALGYTYDVYRSLRLDYVASNIRTNFHLISINTLSYLSSGYDNSAFLLNNEYVFRFSRHNQAQDLLAMEARVLPQLKDFISLPIPKIEYCGIETDGGTFVGYPLIAGEIINANDFSQKRLLAKEIALFFTQLHSFSITTAKNCGVPQPLLQARYAGQQRRVEEVVFPVLRKNVPSVADRTIKYITALFNSYLGNSKNFVFQPSLCHANIKCGHVLFSPADKAIAGIIDFGDLVVHDPDFDLWRLYEEIGKDFIESVLNVYVCSDPARVCSKLDFFMNARMLQRLVRAVLSGKPLDDLLNVLQRRADSK